MNTAAVSPAEARSLRLSEVFFSLQGETSRIGLPTIFVRLTGCPLRCRWCDTEHAFFGGELMDIPSLLAIVAEFPSRYVTVTGGEPLAQKACLPLLSSLCDAGYDVSLETSGCFDIAPVDGRVSRIMDIKAPGSGESERNFWPNIECLELRDEVKVVLADRNDYDWAKDVLVRYRLSERCPVIFSPVLDSLSAVDLASWILADGLSVRFQLQLHKVLWGNLPGR